MRGISTLHNAYAVVQDLDNVKSLASAKAHEYRVPNLRLRYTLTQPSTNSPQTSSESKEKSPEKDYSKLDPTPSVSDVMGIVTLLPTAVVRTN